MLLKSYGLHHGLHVFAIAWILWFLHPFKPGTWYGFLSGANMS